MAALDHIRGHVRWCESAGVVILCCPEAILGGLADNARDPRAIALRVDTGQLATTLGPLASDSVTTIVGFTEITSEGTLYNSAAIFHHGKVSGVFRKLHPAIRRSVYQAGTHTPVFTVAGLTFGVLICYDSTFAESARSLAAQGARVVFVPSNNGLPADRADVLAASRATDTARATETGMWVVRADVAGRMENLVAYGTTAIVDPAGHLVAAARPFTDELIVADLPVVEATKRPDTRQ